MDVYFVKNKRKKEGKEQNNVRREGGNKDKAQQTKQNKTNKNEIYVYIKGNVPTQSCHLIPTCQAMSRTRRVGTVRRCLTVTTGLLCDPTRNKELSTDTADNTLNMSMDAEPSGITLSVAPTVRDTSLEYQNRRKFQR